MNVVIHTWDNDTDHTCEMHTNKQKIEMHYLGLQTAKSATVYCSTKHAESSSKYFLTKVCKFLAGAIRRGS